MNEEDLTAAYKYGPLALGGYLARTRKSKEGSDVYIGKSAAFVLRDFYMSDEATKKREELRKEIDNLKSQIKSLRSNPSTVTANEAEESLRKIKEGLGLQ